MVSTPNQYMCMSALNHNSCNYSSAYSNPIISPSLGLTTNASPSALIIISDLAHVIFPVICKSRKYFSNPIPYLDVSWIALAAVQVLLLLVYACHRVWIHRREQHGSRDPKTWPIIGSQLEASRNYDRLLDWTTGFFSEDHRTVKMSFLSRRSYYTVDPANVEHILKTNFQNYPKGRESHHRLFDLLGNGILNTDGSTWKMHRKLGSLEFSVKKLRHLSSTVYKAHALKLVEALAKANRGVDVQELLLDMTFQSICEVVFGTTALDHHGGSGADYSSVAAALDNAQEMISRRYIYPWWRIQRLFNIGSERVFREDITKFKLFLTNVIERRQSELMMPEGATLISSLPKTAGAAEGDKLQEGRIITASSSSGVPDLLSHFLCHTDNQSSQTSEAAAAGSEERIEMVRDAMMSFVFAGRDTTASTLSWFLYCMCTHAEEQEKVYQELIELELKDTLQHAARLTSSTAINCVYSSRTAGEDILAGAYSTSIMQERSRAFAARVLSYEALQSSSMPYLHSALAETLRLYPAVPRDGKVALKDDMLPDGTHLKAGDQVAYIPYAMGRMPFLWGPDALDFKPQRWLRNGAFEPESPFKFTAFQAGPRMCLGKDAAYLQMKITAALLLRFFRFELVPDHPVEYRMMSVMTMKHGLRVNATPRFQLIDYPSS